MSLLQKAARLLRIGKSRYIVGTDLAGNSYLELPSLSGSTHPRHTRRSIQCNEKKDQWRDYDQKSIPVQWLMWLRHTRSEPPSIDELVSDRERILITQANAAKLALQQQQQASQSTRMRIQSNPDHHVWAASRAPLAAKGQHVDVSPKLHQAMDTRAGSNHDHAERERTRREMSKSPLDAFVPMPKPRK